MQYQIPVVCDRCRASGRPGADPFAGFGALLDFTPVPRRNARADGWDAQCQRAFIAALSLTGSPRAAARAVGKAQYGVTQLLAAPGNEGFCAAYREAMAIAADERSRRLVEGLGAVAAEQAGWRPPDAPWSNARTRNPPLPFQGRGTARSVVESPAVEGPSDPRTPDDERWLWLDRLVRTYRIKLEQERTARLAGQIVAADFYLRQLTYVEVLIDLAGTDGFRILTEHRERGTPLIAMAETPMSRLLDEARRAKWAELGEPPRPAPIPRDLLADHGRFSIEPPEATRGGLDRSHVEQRAAFEKRHRQAAADQVAWEEAARQEHDRRRDSAAGS
ncbi:hypothetical protein SH591_07485 [Sphingomonas sp. LY54]|uniref:hypothetical protein n=1 Tax=Sphingomonas sp. LY54 TaxID=3095343 RepID=UPI002D7947F9|nr:hypothetical protein [Sphingomonas sp. LY54]WRP30004.1 hypothetical protein SH591_07485 [Sphingomonas sp. LY54]